jgi:hypothetical protein
VFKLKMMCNCRLIRAYLKLVVFLPLWGGSRLAYAVLVSTRICNLFVSVDINHKDMAIRLGCCCKPDLFYLATHK